MQILGIIPARYASTRFPGKPLIDIAGKSMIQRVYEQCLKSNLLSTVYVATDDIRIAEHITQFGGNVVMTSEQHTCGTERCFETLTQLGEKEYDVVINIQGDEPFINPEQIDMLCSCFDSERVEIATLAKKLNNSSDLFNPTIPKVVLNNVHNAIYFSRQAIPYLRGIEENEWINNHIYFKHIGIYGYRSDILKEIVSLPAGKLEKAESLEQLRWLENGYKIKVAITNFESISIDTPADLERALKMI
ncbi:MAG: 3-deoxy-manno-octulosonate cytidylyltransferase [Bacteroidetes bacterium]|nr:3-deoxy-manno-octulosonate cytidylyltransferase [Bacteroidota bacterium]